jgi:lysophospholipase L1-like esterase
LRKAHPDTPILAITPIYSVREAAGQTENDGMREHIRQVVSQRIGAGDRNLQIVEGTDLLGPERGDGLVDGTHPNDLGFQWMAEGLVPRLRRVLAITRSLSPGS